MRSILRERSSTQQHKQQQQPQQQPRTTTPLEESASQYTDRRREKLSFLKYGREEGGGRRSVQRSVSSMNRSREHARQLTQLNNNNNSALTRGDRDGDSQSSSQQHEYQSSSKIAAFADFQSAFGASNDTTSRHKNNNNNTRRSTGPQPKPFDDSFSDASSFYDQDHFGATSANNNMNNNNNNATSGGRGGPSRGREQQEQQQSPVAHQRIGRNNKNNNINKNSSHGGRRHPVHMMQQQHQPMMDDLDVSGESSLVTDNDWPSTAAASSSPRSMMTMPSNSSMQSNFVHIKQQQDGSYHRQTTSTSLSNNNKSRRSSQQQQQEEMPFSSNHHNTTTTSNRSTGSSNSSAAARRRVRTQMRADSLERSSVVSDSSSVHSLTSSQGSSSHRARRRVGGGGASSSGSGGGGGAAAETTTSTNRWNQNVVSQNGNHNNNHSGASSQRQYSTGGTSSANHHHHHPASSVGSTRSAASSNTSSSPPPGGHSSHNNTNNNSSVNATSMVDLFDSSAGAGAGFSFDAFGLDASQMNAQLNRAMHDLAGSHPEIMMNGPFLTTSSTTTTTTPNDDLATNRWNDSPTPSRSSTPAPGNYGNHQHYHHHLLEEETDGFVDGFRVRKQHAQQQQQQSRPHANNSIINTNNNSHTYSPSGSTERSSITSETSSQDHSMNAFKEKPGFVRRPRIVASATTTTTTTTSMQPNLSRATRSLGGGGGGSSSSSKQQQQRVRHQTQRQEQEIEFVDVESDVMEPPSSQPRQEHLEQAVSAATTQQQPPSRRPQHASSDPLQQQQSLVVMGRSDMKRRPIPGGLNVFEDIPRRHHHHQGDGPPLSDPGGPSDLSPTEFGDFGDDDGRDGGSGLGAAPSTSHSTNAPSDLGVNSDYSNVGVGGARSSQVAGGGGGTQSNVPSDVGVSSDAGMDGDAVDAGHSGLHRPSHDGSSSIPLQVFSSNMDTTEHDNKNNNKTTRNLAKGSEDTATTASTGYSSNMQQRHQSNHSSGDQYEEKKEDWEPLRSPLESKSNASSQQQQQPLLTQAHLEALESQYSRHQPDDEQGKNNRGGSHDIVGSESPAAKPQSFLRNDSGNNNVRRDVAVTPGIPSSTVKSEGGGRFRQPETISAAMERLASPRNKGGGATTTTRDSTTQSDVGSAPPEYFKVKLRRTGVKTTDEPSPTQSSQEQDSNQDNRLPATDSLVEIKTSGSSSPKAQPHSLEENRSFPMSKRTKTYRQRRERKLQQEQHQRQQSEITYDEEDEYEQEEDNGALQGQSMPDETDHGGQEQQQDQQRPLEREAPTLRKQQPQEPASAKQGERDVASLIKRRIAANKRSAEQERLQQQASTEQEEERLQQPQQHQRARQQEVGPQEKDATAKPSTQPAQSLFEQPPTSELASREERKHEETVQQEEPALDPRAALMKALKARVVPAAKDEVVKKEEVKEEQQQQPKRKGDSPARLDSRPAVDIANTRSSLDENHVPRNTTPKATKMMLNAFLAGRESVGENGVKSSKSGEGAGHDSENNRPALKDDPQYERYFKMLKLGMPMEVVQHAMIRDGLDPSVMDGDHNKPVPLNGVPLKDDPEYDKYFKMLKIGMPMDAVKHAMLRDGLDCSVMDQDRNLPVGNKKAQGVQPTEPEEKDSHRRARLHWKTLRKVTSNSLWARLDQDISMENIEIDEHEFQELFQVEKGEAIQKKSASTSAATARATSVRVIDGKRANNGGIILARLKMSHDEMADAVDRINENLLSAEQIENIIEYLPSKEERRALESYMLEGGQDAAEKFEGLCECEKFMVSMMTVKHAKRKVRALLFKLQFEHCLDGILQDTLSVEAACDELFNSVRLRQLLGIILTFGNRLNTAGNKKRKAGAFTLDSLLKLNQAKAFDKKTTFLHYVILIIQRNNEILLRFKDDLSTVFKADKIFWDQCLTDLDEVESQLENVRRIALHQARQSSGYWLRRHKSHSGDDGEESLSDGEISLTLEEEVEALRATPIGVFTLSAIKYVSSLRDKVEETRSKYARLLEYFGEEESTWQPHELFSTIAKFCRDFDKAKEEVRANEKKKQREERKRQSVATNGKPPTHSTPDRRPQPEKKKMVRASSVPPSSSAVMRNSHAPKNGAGPEPRENQQQHQHSTAGQPDYSQESIAPQQVPLHDTRDHVEPNSETVLLRGRPQSGHEYSQVDQHTNAYSNPHESQGGDFYHENGTNRHSVQQDEAASPYGQCDNPKGPDDSMLGVGEEVLYEKMVSPGRPDVEAINGRTKSPHTTPTKQYYTQPITSAQPGDVRERSPHSPMNNPSPDPIPNFRTPEQTYRQVSLEEETNRRYSSERRPSGSASTSSNQEKTGAGVQSNKSSAVPKTQSEASFGEPLAQMNARSLNISSLRQKARMRGNSHRGPSANSRNSSSAQGDAEPATPFVSVKAREAATHQEQPSHTSSSGATQMNHERPSTKRAEDGPSKPKQLSPRSTFRLRRRMEARERMRQEKEACQED